MCSHFRSLWIDQRIWYQKKDCTPVVSHLHLPFLICLLATNNFFYSWPLMGYNCGTIFFSHQVTFYAVFTFMCTILTWQKWLFYGHSFTARKQKQRKEEPPRVPRSLFDKPKEVVMKQRRDAKMQRLRQNLQVGVILLPFFVSYQFKQQYFYLEHILCALLLSAGDVVLRCWLFS